MRACPHWKPIPRRRLRHRIPAGARYGVGDHAPRTRHTVRVCRGSGCRHGRTYQWLLLPSRPVKPGSELWNLPGKRCRRCAAFGTRVSAEMPQQVRRGHLAGNMACALHTTPWNMPVVVPVWGPYIQGFAEAKPLTEIAGLRPRETPKDVPAHRPRTVPAYAPFPAPSWHHVPLPISPLRRAPR